LIEIVSSSWTSQLSGMSVDAPSRNASYSSPGRRASVERMTVTPRRSSGAINGSRAASARRKREPL
jgi:hypothetical protein